MKFVNSFIILALNFQVPASKLFFKLGLFISKSCKEVIIVASLLIDGFSEGFDLVRTFIDLVIRHVDGAKDVGFRFGLFSIATFHFSDFGCSQWTCGKLPANNL